MINVHIKGLLTVLSMPHYRTKSPPTYLSLYVHTIMEAFYIIYPFWTGQVSKSWAVQIGLRSGYLYVWWGLVGLMSGGWAAFLTIYLFMCTLTWLIWHSIILQFELPTYIAWPNHLTTDNWFIYFFTFIYFTFKYNRKSFSFLCIFVV